MTATTANTGAPRAVTDGRAARARRQALAFAGCPACCRGLRHAAGAGLAELGD